MPYALTPFILSSFKNKHFKIQRRRRRKRGGTAGPALPSHLSPYPEILATIPEFLTGIGTPSDSCYDLWECALIPPVKLIYVEFYLPPHFRHHNTSHACTLCEEAHSSTACECDWLWFYQWSNPFLLGRCTTAYAVTLRRRACAAACVVLAVL